MLAEGADPNISDYDKRTPLHVACSDGHLMVRLAFRSPGMNLWPLNSSWASYCRLFAF